MITVNLLNNHRSMTDVLMQDPWLTLFHAIRHIGVTDSEVSARDFSDSSRLLYTCRNAILIESRYNVWRRQVQLARAARRMS